MACRRQRQAIIWTSAGILLIRPLGTHSSEILIGVQTFSFKKMHLKMSSAKWRPFCPGLNVLTKPPLNQSMGGWLELTLDVDVIIYPCPNLSADLTYLC